VGSVIAGSGIPATASAIGPEKLVVVSPEAMKGMEFPVGGEVTVGRAGGCAVLLPADSFVSQLHARLFRRDGSLYVEDLGSTNGTFLNGKKVSAPVSVRKGDKVQFGRTTLEVRK
jgi:pSer/pThr/pTyr-binding forkhead associated (FHA) protein